MQQPEQTVILLIIDSLVREGLKLLLEGMQFSVIALSTYRDFKQYLSSEINKPALIILPPRLENGLSGFGLVSELQTRFSNTVPLIIFSSDNSLHPSLIANTNYLILPEQTDPKTLRKKIKEITRLKTT